MRARCLEVSFVDDSTNDDILLRFVDAIGVLRSE